MALDTTPGAGCESLASVAQADAYHESRGNIAQWDALEGTRKEQLLRLAYDYLYDTYAGSWSDEVEFGAVDALGTVPVKMVQASALLALYALSGPLNGAPGTAPQVVEKTVGPITTKYATQTAPPVRTFPDVVRMVAPFLVAVPSPYSAKLVRS